MNKEKLNTIIKYLIAKGVTAEDFLDIFFENTKSATTIYTASEVCSKLNVKPADLKQMIADGDLPAPDNKGKWSHSTLAHLL